MSKLFTQIFLLIWLPLIAGCAHEEQTAKGNQDFRIVSLNGAISEVLVLLGMEENMVGVDVTSTYPPSLKKLEQLGHPRNLSVEGLLAAQPKLVLVTEGLVAQDKLEQIRSAGVQVEVLAHGYSAAGVEKLIAEVAQAVDKEQEGKRLIQDFRAKMPELQGDSGIGRVLFIYARGSGNLMVAGNHTPAAAFIQMVGGENAVSDFEGFKTLSAEALLMAKPDRLLLFDTGLQSLGGIDGLMEVPGIAETPAGQSQNVLTMDGQLMLGFGPRLPEALNTFHQKIQAPVVSR